MDYISREVLNAQFESKLSSGQKIHIPAEKTVSMASTMFGPASNVRQDEATFRLMENAKHISRQGNITLTGKYRSGFDFDFNGQSVNELVRAGKFVSNTMPQDWQKLWDAMRLDLTIKKEAKQTVRQYVYNVVSMPNATRIINPQEMYPYAFEFKLNNGEGQAVPLGEAMLGATDTIKFEIFATGFKYTVLASLFDRSLDFNRMNEGVAEAYALKRDDDAMSPILDYNYGATSGAKHTGPHVDASMKRQELLYNTLLDAIDELGLRSDPLTKQKIIPNGLILLASTHDANHIRRVMGGLPSVNERIYGSIPEISRIVAYDTEYTTFSNKVIEYKGVTPGTAYLIKPNRYMMIPVKKELTMEADLTPDVLTLAQQERSWYYSEAIYNAIGIANFVQKITLPTW